MLNVYFIVCGTFWIYLPHSMRRHFLPIETGIPNEKEKENGMKYLMWVFVTLHVQTKYMTTKVEIIAFNVNMKCSKLNRNNYENEIRYFMCQYWSERAEGRKCWKFNILLPSAWMYRNHCWILLFHSSLSIADLVAVPTIINSNEEKSAKSELFIHLCHITIGTQVEIPYNQSKKKKMLNFHLKLMAKDKLVKFHCRLNYEAWSEGSLDISTTSNANQAIIKRLTNNEQYLSFNKIWLLVMMWTSPIERYELTTWIWWKIANNTAMTFIKAKAFALWFIPMDLH